MQWNHPIKFIQVKSLFYLLFVIVGCDTTPKEDIARSIEVAQTDSPTSVTLHPVGESVHYRYVECQGKVSYAEQLPLRFAVGGTVTEVRVANADDVKKGQLLAKLDEAELQLQRKEALVRYQSAQLEYQNQLAGAGDSTRHGERWSVIKKNLRLIAGVSAAAVALEQLDYRLNQLSIKAPFQGRLVDWDLQTGQQVTASVSVGTLMNPSSGTVEVRILEYELPGLQTGDQADLVLTADPSRMFQGYVQEINPRVEKDGFVRVRIKINDSSELLTGQSVQVQLKIPQGVHLQVPAKALVRKGDRFVVFTEEDGQAKWNYVMPGSDNGEMVVIQEGLSAGMRAIVSNNLQLAHDSPVKISDPSSPN